MNYKPLLVIALLLCVQSVVAYQDKIAMKECSYSFNDKNFGSWNENLQKGVFLSIINNNYQNVGPGQEASYQVTDSYQAPRIYWTVDATDARNGAGILSTVPLLQVRDGQENMLYANCTYNVPQQSSFRMSIFLAMCTEGCGSSPELQFSYDYNLSEGIVITDLQNYFKETLYAFRGYNPATTPVGYYRNKMQALPREEILYADTQGPEGPAYSSAEFPSQRQFYQNTKPNVISAINLSEVASGLFRAVNGHADNGGTILIGESSLWETVFYINSTKKRVSENLAPKFNKNWEQTVVDLTQGITKTGCYYPDYSWLPPGVGTQSCIAFSPGDQLRIEYNYTNPYNALIPPVNITSIIAFDVDGTGIAGAGTDVYWFINATQFTTPWLAPYESRMIVDYVTLPDDVASLAEIPRVFPALLAIPQISRGGVFKDRQYYLLGGDPRARFLYFGRLDLFLTLNNGVPAFNVTADLQVAPSILQNDVPQIGPNEYAILVTIIEKNISNPFGVEFSNFTIPLDNQIFATQFGGFNLNATTPRKFNVLINVTNQMLARPGSRFSPLFTTLKLTGLHAGRRISTFTTEPTFQAGDLQYALSQDFQIYNYQSGRDVKTIRIFNPDFSSSHTLNLSFINLTFPAALSLFPTNTLRITLNDTKTSTRVQCTFTPSSFPSGQTTVAASCPALSLNLNRLESREVQLIVEARYFVWPNADVLPPATFVLEAVSDQTQPSVKPSSVPYTITIHEFVPFACEEVYAPDACVQFSTVTDRCYWNYVRSSSADPRTAPPGIITSPQSICVNCNITDPNLACSTYNNDVSCVRDTCNLVPQPFDRCDWYVNPLNSADQHCVAVKDDCWYNITSSCTTPPQEATGTLTYTILQGSCNNFTVTVPCSEYITLSFISPTNMVIIIALLGVLYFLRGRVQAKH